MTVGWTKRAKTLHRVQMQAYTQPRAAKKFTEPGGNYDYRSRGYRWHRCFATATLSHARQSAAAARAGKVAVSGGNATYVGTKNLVPQDFSPKDATEALKGDGSDGGGA